MSQEYFLTCQKLLEQCEYTKAKAGFDFILMCNPKSFEAFRGIANCELASKNWRQAIIACLNAIGHGGNKQEDLDLLVLIIETSVLLTYIPQLEAPLLLASKNPMLAFRTKKQLWQQIRSKYKNVFLDSSTHFNAETRQLLQDKIFCQVLSNSILTNYKLEELVLLCRHEILSLAAAGKDIHCYLPFISSFASLSLLNDGLYFTREQDKILIKQISQCKSKIENVLLLLCFADLDTAIAIWQENQSTLVGAHVTNLVADLKFYSEVNFPSSSVFLNDKTSRLVQSFYMENPYPKWKMIEFHGFRLDRVYQKVNLDFVPVCQILSAGCGTGQQVINLALNNPQARITAIDLSPVSLDYCKKMALKFNLNNIELQLLDILEIDKLNQSFDFIICTGVLHHMADPQLGLANLESVLKHNGLMLVAFYSSTARKLLSNIKQTCLNFSDKNETQVSRKDVRQWRSQLSDEQKHHPLYNLSDFFYLNGLYDLLFHPQQIEYNLSEMSEMITQSGLKFECMEVDNQVTAKFREITGSFPVLGGEITDWQQVEQKHPETFIGMYNFYLTKQFK
jgi:2-polyprenyl-3-methyl-5-hydroxy-6-metoxy-1,4-benzoquinol methylase